MEIKITKDSYGHMMATEGVISLFEFEYRAKTDAWYFWLPGRAHDPHIVVGKKFPMDYFIDACRAVHFLRNNAGLDESVIMVGIMHTIVK